MERKFYTIKLFFLILSTAIITSCEKTIEDSAATPSQTKCIPNDLPNQFKAIFMSEQIPNNVDPLPIAIFQFSQGMKTYTNTTCKNLPNTCATSLKIQNISGKRMRLAFTIEYLQGNNYWSSDGFADIPKDSCFNSGVVSTNCGWITSEGLRVTKKSVSFE